MGIILVSHARHQFWPQLFTPPLKLRTPFESLSLLFHPETIALLVANSAVLLDVLSDLVLRVVVKNSLLDKTRPHVLRIVLVIPDQKVVR